MNQNNNGDKIDLSDILDDSKGHKELQHHDQISQAKMPKIVRWIIKCSGGCVKNETQAGYVILGFFVSAIIISLFLIFGSGPKIDEKYIFDPNSPEANIND